MQPSQLVLTAVFTWIVSLIIAKRGRRAQAAHQHARIVPRGHSLASSTEEEISVVTWNLLAPSLATPSKHPLTHPHHLAWAYRAALLRRELAALGADVVCLQGVDGSRWDEVRAWLPGYQALLQQPHPITGVDGSAGVDGAAGGSSSGDGSGRCLNAILFKPRFRLVWSAVRCRSVAGELAFCDSRGEEQRLLVTCVHLGASCPTRPQDRVPQLMAALQPLQQRLLEVQQQHHHEQQQQQQPLNHHAQNQQQHDQQQQQQQQLDGQAHGHGHGQEQQQHPNQQQQQQQQQHDPHGKQHHPHHRGSQASRWTARHRADAADLAAQGITLEVPLLVVGDFGSEPGDGPWRLLHNGRLERWATEARTPTFPLTTIPLAQPFSLREVYHHHHHPYSYPHSHAGSTGATASAALPFTRKVAGCVSTTDCVWASPSLETCALYAPVDADSARRDASSPAAYPDASHPSHHLPLGALLRITTAGSGGDPCGGAGGGSGDRSKS